MNISIICHVVIKVMTTGLVIPRGTKRQMAVASIKQGNRTWNKLEGASVLLNNIKS